MGNKEKIFESGEPVKLPQIILPKDKFYKNGSGKHSKIKSSDKSGKYIRSAITDKFTDDIAIDATLRAAAPFQNLRKKFLEITDDIKKDNSSLIIENTDIRKKIREKKIGNVTVFLIDSSGSMGANKKMIETKGILSAMLIEAYQKRDRVGLVVFKGNTAEVLQKPTPNLEIVKKKIDEIPTGGKTPLLNGILKGIELINNELKKNNKIKPVIIVISDGRLNINASQKYKFEEELEFISHEIKKNYIKTVFVDTEDSFVSLGKMKDISIQCNGYYVKAKESL